MSNEPKKQSAYADTLYRFADALCRSSRGGFTLVDLKNASGLPITGNMRRRINHSVATGTLAMTHAYDEQGHRHNFYYHPMPPQPVDQELPF